MNNLTEVEKYRLYFKYTSVRYGLKRWFSVKYEGEDYYEPENWKNPDEVFKGLHFRYLWKDLPEPKSFKEFIQEKEGIDYILHWYMVENNHSYFK